MRRYLLSFLLIVIGAAGAEPAAALEPVKSISLTTCGWNRNQQLANQRHIGFDSQGNIWAAFLLKPSKLVRRGENPLRAVTLSGSPLTCAVRFERPGSTSQLNSLFVTPEDHFIVLAGDRLHLIDAAGSDLATYHLNVPQGALYRVMLVPGGQTLVAMVDEGGATRVTRLSSTLLRALGTCLSSAHPWLSSAAPDGRILTAVVTNRRPNFGILSDFCPSQPRRLQREVYMRPEAVNEAQNAVFSESGFSVLSLEGKLLFEHRLGRGDVYAAGAAVRASDDGRLLGVEVDRHGAGGAPAGRGGKRTGPRIDIYRTTGWKQIAQVHLPAEAEGGLDFCFSRDGKSLAVLEAGAVQVFELPN